MRPIINKPLNPFMSELTIYHNPRCSKSRQTLALIQEKGIEPEIVLYLQNPPTIKELAEILKKLDINARNLLRKGEQEYKTLKLANTDLCEQQLIEAMSKHPKLIERPIVVKAEKAVLGRPPENVLSLI